MAPNAREKLGVFVDDTRPEQRPGPHDSGAAWADR